MTLHLLDPHAQQARCLAAFYFEMRWEVAVNRPISFHATAGFYYFASGMTFVDAAKQMILGDVMVNDQFYVAPVFNELVLKNRHLRAYSLPNETYHTFYSPQKIKEFELGRE